MFAPLGGSLSNLINERLNAFQPPFLHGRANKQDTPESDNNKKKKIGMNTWLFWPFYYKGCAELPFSIICTSVVLRKVLWIFKLTAINGLIKSSPVGLSTWRENLLDCKAHSDVCKSDRIELSQIKLRFITYLLWKVVCEYRIFGYFMENFREIVLNKHI